MKIGITGANGFVGSMTMKRLSEAGHNVIPLKRPDWTIDDGTDVVVNCAAYIPPSYHDRSEFEKCMTNNAIGPLRLLDEAEKRGVKKFVHLSSGQIYRCVKEESDYRVPEDSPMDPIERASPYLISKMAGDCSVRSHRGKTQVVVLRPASIYGPGMKPVGIIHRLLNSIKNKELIDMTREDYFTDLVHVEDVVAMIKHCTLESKAIGVYNVGGGNPVQTAHLAKMLADILRVELPSNKPAPHLGHPALDISRATQHFKYTPQKTKVGLESYLSTL